MIWDLWYWAHEGLGIVREEFERRPWTHWVFATFALVLFLEIPRYYLTLVAVAVLQTLHWPRRRVDRIEALWRREPLVSVVVAGRNEGETIEACIRSLLEQNWKNYEILVVDDHSEDDMNRIARRFVRDPRVRVLRNGGVCGRGGRPSASNLGLAAARGEFFLSVDADCSFDRNLIRNAIAPFADPRVGVVAGNVHVRNPHKNLLTQLQALEYAVSIDLRKRWTTLFGCTLQASGACGAFRTEVLRRIQGWDPEMAEDTDISLRTRKMGYQVHFEPKAAVLTEVPAKLGTLIRQRGRWDRGGLRAYYSKHKRLLNPRHAGWSMALEMWQELYLSIFAALGYPVYLACMLWWAPAMLAVILVFMTAVNCWLSLLSLALVAHVTPRVEQPSRLWLAALVTPLYKGFFRWVRCRAVLCELLRVRYEDPFLPRTVWREAPRF